MHTGIPMYFVRLQGCSVGCYFCDTKYTWKPEDQTVKEEDIIVRAKQSGALWVCITGGEPYEQDLTELVKEARKHGLKTHVETSGTVYQPSLIDWVCLSPKDLFSKKKTVQEMKIRADEIKCVVTKEADIDYYEKEYEDLAEELHVPFILQPVDNNKEIAEMILHRVAVRDTAARIMIQQHKVLGLR